MSTLREIKTGAEPRPGAEPGEVRHKRRRKRRRKRPKGIPAPIVFYTTGTLSLMSSTLVYLRGGWLLLFSIATSLLLLAALLINERVGFSGTHRARRASEARDKFTMLETAVLFVLLLLGIYVSIVSWMTM